MPRFLLRFAPLFVCLVLLFLIAILRISQTSTFASSATGSAQVRSTKSDVFVPVRKEQFLFFVWFINKDVHNTSFVTRFNAFCFAFKCVHTPIF